MASLPTVSGSGIKLSRCLAEAHYSLQGYLDEKHRGVWQDKVHPKLVITANGSRTDFAYICKKTTDHRRGWTGRS